MRPDFPRFEKPPVVEVALSISFESLQGYRSAHAGRFWEGIKDRFPLAEDQSELQTAIEGPGGPVPPPRFEMVERPRIRTWLQDNEKTQLLQLQHNRIVYNWKGGWEGHPYPSYDEVERRFRDLVPMFVQFVEREKLGKIVVTQAELTYVNHIHRAHDSVDRVIGMWGRSHGDGFLPAVEDVRFSARYPIVGADKELIGRFVVELLPAYVTATGEEILRLNLLARGKPKSPDVEGAFEFLRLGHEWIVRGFAEVTTAEMQSEWRRTQ